MADEQKTRFTKIKFDGSKVRLEYQITKKDGTPDEYVISSSDQPDRAFPTALAALAADVLEGGECWWRWRPAAARRAA